MSRKHSQAPPVEAFRDSVLGALSRSSSNSSTSARHQPLSLGKRPLRAISSSVVEETQQQSLTAPPLMRRSSSLLAGMTSSHNNNSNIASHLSALAQPLARRRSSLFDHLPTRSSHAGTSLLAVPESNPAPPSFFFQKLSQNSTLLGDGGDGCSTNNNSSFQTNNHSTDEAPLDQDSNTSSTMTPTKKTSRSTLFGAVMEKLGNKHTSSPPNKHDNPTNSSGATAPFKSPSGKSIMNFMNMISSPFRFHSPRRVGAGSNAKRRLSIASSPPSPGRTKTTPTSTPQRKRARTTGSSPSHYLNQDGTTSLLSTSSSLSLHDDDNWREAPIHQEQAEILDWSLNTRVELECHPADALSDLLRCREWKDALLYWVYAPSSSLSSQASGVAGKIRQVEVKEAAGEVVSVTKAELVRIKGSGTDQKGSAAFNLQATTMQDPSMDLATRLIRSVRQGMHSAPAPGRGGASSSDQTPDTTEELPPTREWQQSFRSLYFQWCQQVQWERHLSTTILDHYFYCVAHDHVVLFRFDDAGDACLPRVLISSAGACFLQDLQDANVESMKVLRQPAPSKSSLEDEDRSCKANPMSPTVKADLEALRKAQHFGEVAGADISIKIKGSKTESISLEPTTLAVTLSGYDDVAAFFEIYYNRLGQTEAFDSGSYSSLKLTQNLRLPRLIAPNEIGPFLHASMKTLDAHPVLPKGIETDIGNAAIHGPIILPSVIRRVVALAASKLSTSQPTRKDDAGRSPFSTLKPTRKDEAGSSPYSPKLPSSDDALGSRYLVLHTAVDIEKPSLATIRATKKRSIKHSTVMFNDIHAKESSADIEPTCKPGTRISECRLGTTLQLIVWDVSRSNVAACKMGGLH